MSLCKTSATLAFFRQEVREISSAPPARPLEVWRRNFFAYARSSLGDVRDWPCNRGIRDKIVAVLRACSEVERAGSTPSPSQLDQLLVAARALLLSIERTDGCDINILALRRLCSAADLGAVEPVGGCIDMYCI